MASDDLFISTGAGGRDKEVVDYLNQLFLYALHNGVSDIHFEAGNKGWTVRIRQQGKLVEAAFVRADAGREINEKIRAKASLELIDRGQPLDGRFSLIWTIDGHELSADVRVSIVPTERGLSIVCRVLDSRAATRELSSIDMMDDVRKCITQIIREPDGLFLVTGPTGSGKTSTLYSIINELNSPERKILTIEDPVEYKVPGLQQVGVTNNNSFLQALRAALRQDPDIILVGEIRDAETARVAIQAASTGHLVLSTLHTNDAPTSVMRLIDLGVDPFTLGTCLRGILAQRLVQSISGPIKHVAPTEEEKLWMHGHGIEDLLTPFSEPINSDDMKGRIPIMELLMVDNNMKQAMAKNDLRAIKTAAEAQKQYLTLAQAGVALTRAGKTTIKEARSIASSMDDSNNRKKIGELLISEGYITQKQLDKGLREQIKRKTEGKVHLIGELLVEMGYCTRDEVNHCVAMQ